MNLEKAMMIAFAYWPHMAIATIVGGLWWILG
jgi:hypothetical protein